MKGVLDSVDEIIGDAVTKAFQLGLVTGEAKATFWAERAAVYLAERHTLEMKLGAIAEAFHHYHGGEGPPDKCSHELCVIMAAHTPEEK